MVSHLLIPGMNWPVTDMIGNLNGWAVVVVVVADVIVVGMVYIVVAVVDLVADIVVAVVAGAVRFARVLWMTEEEIRV